MSVPSVGQWRSVEVDGRDYLAHLTVEMAVDDPPQPDGAFVAKWVAVLYRDPAASAHYVRGESFTSFEDALSLARSLLRGLPIDGSQPSAVTNKMAVADGVASSGIEGIHGVSEADEPPLCPCGKGYVGHEHQPEERPLHEAETGVK